MRNVSRVTTAIAEGPATQWDAGWLAAQPAERELVAAALRCIGRWGIRKTSLEDIAAEAGVSRATVYRVFPGGKERLVDTVVHHEVGRLIHERHHRPARRRRPRAAAHGRHGGGLVDRGPRGAAVGHRPRARARRCRTSPSTGSTACSCSPPTCAGHISSGSSRPTRSAAATELLVRVAVTLALRPADWLDTHDPESVRRLVRTYLRPLAPRRRPDPVRHDAPTLSRLEEH